MRASEQGDLVDWQTLLFQPSALSFDASRGDDCQFHVVIQDMIRIAALPSDLEVDQVHDRLAHRRGGYRAHHPP
ncbi:MAG TPA: hypothetical protein VGE09_10955 [Pseudoxanthomonas sp.]